MRTISPPLALLYREVDLCLCEATRRSPVRWRSKIPWRLRSVQSERLPTKRFRCHGDAGPDDVPGTVER
jgi:hypothetical protein